LRESNGCLLLGQEKSMIQERTAPTFDATSVDLSKDEGLMLYEDMMLGRLFEDKCAEMYYRGKMFGFVHLYNGQEAVSTGTIRSMRRDADFVCSTYRDHVHALSAGVPAKEVMAELFGKETGCSKGRGGSMHMFSADHHLLGGFAFVAEGIPVATGAAFQSKYRRETMEDESADTVTACFFGDGACNNGQFYECLNMAALWKLPIIYVVENNKWAIGMAHERATSEPEIYKKAAPFGIKGVEVDGMDVLAVRAAAQEAIARARAGEGPTLIEALTYRFRGHSLADPDELRSKEEKDFWLSRDPIKRLANYLEEQNLATQEELDAIEKQVQEVVNEAVEFAENSPEPDASELRRYVFAED
jgi:pyruvate dehydrogenase E1 component alpha subunit